MDAIKLTDEQRETLEATATDLEVAQEAVNKLQALGVDVFQLNERIKEAAKIRSDLLALF